MSIDTIRRLRSKPVDERYRDFATSLTTSLCHQLLAISHSSLLDLLSNPEEPRIVG